jgi:hypothetical protein
MFPIFTNALAVYDTRKLTASVLQWKASLWIDIDSHHFGGKGR